MNFPLNGTFQVKYIKYLNKTELFVVNGSIESIFVATVAYLTVRSLRDVILLRLEGNDFWKGFFLEGNGLWTQAKLAYVQRSGVTVNSCP